MNKQTLQALQDYFASLNKLQAQTVELMEELLARLEPGQPSPPTMASPTTKVLSDVELCRGWAPSTEVTSGIVPEPDSPPESTAPAIPRLWPSAPPTTPTFRVEATCGCAEPKVGFLRKPNGDPMNFEMKCMNYHNDQGVGRSVLLAYVQTVVPDVLANPSEST
jgi:hypothetical protein